MGVKYRKDETGKLEKLASSIIKKDTDYISLKHVRILFIWRDGPPRKDEDGLKVAAQASILSSKLRDLFAYDCQVEVSEEIWDRLSPEWRRRLMWHELRHFYVELDEETSEPVKDKEGRVVISIVPHDVIVRTFRAEVEKFGVDTSDLPIFKFAARIVKRVKKGRLRKYAKPTVLTSSNDQT